MRRWWGRVVGAFSVKTPASNGGEGVGSAGSEAVLNALPGCSQPRHNGCNWFKSQVTTRCRTQLRIRCSTPVEGEAHAGLLGSVGFEQSLRRFRSGRSTQPFVGDRVWLGKLNSYFPQELAGVTGWYQSQALVEEVASLQWK
jgi:hypothetical protein